MESYDNEWYDYVVIGVIADFSSSGVMALVMGNPAGATLLLISYILWQLFIAIVKKQIVNGKRQ